MRTCCELQNSAEPPGSKSSGKVRLVFHLISVHGSGATRLKPLRMCGTCCRRGPAATSGCCAALSSLSGLSSLPSASGSSSPVGRGRLAEPPPGSPPPPAPARPAGAGPGSWRRRPAGPRPPSRPASAARSEDAVAPVHRADGALGRCWGVRARMAVELRRGMRSCPPSCRGCKTRKKSSGPFFRGGDAVLPPVGETSLRPPGRISWIWAPRACRCRS